MHVKSSKSRHHIKNEVTENICLHVIIYLICSHSAVGELCAVLKGIVGRASRHCAKAVLFFHEIVVTQSGKMRNRFQITELASSTIIHEWIQIVTARLLHGRSLPLPSASDTWRVVCMYGLLFGTWDD